MFCEAFCFESVFRSAQGGVFVATLHLFGEGRYVGLRSTTKEAFSEAFGRMELFNADHSRGP